MSNKFLLSDITQENISCSTRKKKINFTNIKEKYFSYKKPTFFPI